MKNLILALVATFSVSAFATGYTQISFKGAWQASSEAAAVDAAVSAVQDLEAGVVSGRFFRVHDEDCADISRDVIAKSQFKRKMLYGNGQVRNARISVGSSYDRNGNPSFTSTVKASVPCIKKRNSDDD